MYNPVIFISVQNYRIYISHSQDRKKNPLDFKTKLKYMKKIFPAHAGKIQNSKMRTAIEVAVELTDEGYTDLIMIAGLLKHLHLYLSI